MFNDTNIAINPLAVLKSTKEPRRHMLAYYLKREENSIDLHEYYDGIITKLPPANGLHNIISTNIGTAIKTDSKGKDKKLHILGGKQLIYSSSLNYAVYPDVSVVIDTPLFWDNDQFLLMNPVLIVEILSKTPKRQSRTTKFSEYKTLESFKEYILIDQNKCYIETYFKEKQGVWQGTDYTDINDNLYLKSLDCSIALTDIYENITLKK
jgi:Uma2 family endonuclease